MTPQNRYRAEFLKLIRLAMPMYIAQLAFTSLGVVDTIMSGRVGVNDIAAIGLGSNLMLPVFIFISGILLAITPITARSLGKKQPDRVRFYLQQGMLLALPLGVLGTLLLWSAPLLLQRLVLDPAVFELTSRYLFWAALGLPGVALFQAHRFHWEGLGVTVPTLMMGAAAFALNIPLNAIFIYGFGPVEAMGAPGCGVATALVMWFLFFFSWLYVRCARATQQYRGALFAWPDWQNGIKPITKLGTPMALAMLFEVGMFSFIILFIAAFGTIAVGAHQVTMSFTALLFMLPLSLAMAMTIRVGTAFGREDKIMLQTSIITGMVGAILIGIMLGLLVYVLREQIIGFYTQNSDIAAIATGLFLFAASYQIFDAIQVAVAGVLRGLHDTMITMWVTLFSYWGVGLGGGYILAFKNPFGEPMGVYGFWAAIIGGMFVASVLLSWRLKQQMGKLWPKLDQHSPSKSTEHD